MRVKWPEACGPDAPAPAGPLTRGRRSIGFNLKAADGVDLLLTLLGSADVLVEGFRPGVAERLGLGPQLCAQRNPALIYATAAGPEPTACSPRPARSRTSSPRSSASSATPPDADMGNTRKPAPAP